jgi:hypothetical protein
VEQLKDIGCKWVVLGHSERRHVIGEDDQVKVLTTILMRGFQEKMIKCSFLMMLWMKNLTEALSTSVYRKESFLCFE